MKGVLALIVSCILSQPVYSCTLRMGIETSFAPYILQHGDSWRGMNVELLQRLVQEMGCELEFIHSPWLRSLKLIEQGELDVLSHLSYNAERSKQFAFIGPHQQETIYLVGLPRAFPGLTAVEQLQNSGTTGIIALLNGAYYGDKLDSILNDAKNRTRFVFIRGNEDKQALLLNGRVHGVLEDIAAYHYWKVQPGLPTADYVPLFQVHQSMVYFGFNLRTISSIQLQQLAQAWQKLYADGTLAAIVQRYPLSGYQIKLPNPASLLPATE
ncbi:substrate-binding periplasmic protein [Rheinheimera hassiensis]|uniref:substrate-binding periplasmic protein n=1 Tax=Rheinheimera hassiensis TaxID=1193627 RepID=UPI001F057627|nr:transporter substrate-binding domain-containing protein [Rheinheimera hassiensis]